MATLTIRNLDERVKAKLRLRAASQGISMEEQVRRVLQQEMDASGVREPSTEYGVPDRDRSAGVAPRGQKPIAAWLEDLVRINETEGEMDPIVRTDRNQPEWE